MATDEINLDKYFRTVWRAKWLVLGGVLIAAAIAAWNANRQPTLFSAVANIHVGRVWKNPIDDPNVAAEVVNSDGFAEELSKRVGERPGYVRHSLRADAVTAGPPRAQYTILVRITASAEAAETSVKLAKAAADYLIELHEKVFEEALAPHRGHQRRLEARKEEMSKQGSFSAETLLKVERELDEVRASNNSPTDTEKTRLISDVSRGKVERPQILRSAGTAALIALIFLITAAFIAGYFANSDDVATPPAKQSNAESA